MNTVYFNTSASDLQRRELLYNGQLFVYSPRPSTVALCEHARQMIEEAFGSIDPLRAQYELSVEQYVAIVAPLKPQFIHHPRTKRLIQDILEEFGCYLDETYLDVPRLRMVTSHGYLTSGVGFVHHPHRDTWYSAPMAQVNIWLPIYPIQTESSLAFHPKYWSSPVRNSSDEFNYYLWNSVGRREAARHIKSDTRKQPVPLEPVELDPQIRPIPEAGGCIMFSGAQLHSTVPNSSGLARYSIDFRIVNRSDVEKGIGPENIDSSSTGTSLRDFMRGSDLERMPDEVARRFDAEPAAVGELVFDPWATAAPPTH